jgi:hypothetical protein
MAKDEELPGFYEKRKILFNEKTSDEKMRDTGRQFFEAERYDDALEFFARSEAPDLVKQIAELALERGDTPLFLRAKRVQKEKVTDEEWQTLAQNALDAGCPSKAYVAYLKSGREEKAKELKAQTEGLGEPKEEEEEEDEEEAGPATPDEGTATV